MPNAGPTNEPDSLIQAFEETTFGADMTGSLGSFTAIPFQEGSATFSATRETHDPQHAVQDVRDYREEVLGRKRSSLQFTMPLAPTGTAAGQGTTAVQSALGLLLELVMGGELLTPGSTAASWSNGASGTIATASTLARGGAMGWVDTSGVLHARGVRNNSGTTITSKIAFPAAPATSDVIYGSATYFCTRDPDKSFNFVVRGLESQDDWVLLGMQLDSMTLSLPLDDTIPTVQFNFKGASWLYGSQATGSASLVDITPVAYANTSPITGHAGRFLIQETTTQQLTGAEVPINAVSFEPQITYLEVTSPSGTEGTHRWRLGRNNGPMIQGTFGTFFQDLTWHTGRDNKTDYQIAYQIGTTAGETILIEASTCQLTMADRGDANGIAGVTAQFKGRLDAVVSNQVTGTDVHSSPFRIHFL